MIIVMSRKLKMDRIAIKLEIIVFHSLPESSVTMSHNAAVVIARYSQSDDRRTQCL